MAQEQDQFQKGGLESSLDIIQERIKFDEKGRRRATGEVEHDQRALHQYRLAKAVYSKIKEQKKGNDEDAESLVDENHSRAGQRRDHGHLDHSGNKKSRKLDGGTIRRKGHRVPLKRGATRKQRHRITKKRFMTCIDLDLFKAVLASAKLENSMLWDEDFKANKLSTENVIVCRHDMLKMEVIVEGLKEGLFDRDYIETEPDLKPPTEEMLHEFEKARETEIKLKMAEDERIVLEFARRRAKELGATNGLPGDTLAAETALHEAKEMLIQKDIQRKLDGLEVEDAFTNLVKTLRLPDLPEDEWSINGSTTTGSYQSWRKAKKPKAERGKIFKSGPKHWADKSHRIWLRLIASIIILIYWTKYFSQALDDLFYDVLRESLHVNSVWTFRSDRYSNLEHAFVKGHDWFHFLFTFVAPLIVFKDNSSLGVFYGFSILVDGYVHMYIKAHDISYDSGTWNWETVAPTVAYSIMTSLLFVFFLMFHYLVDNSVEIAREFAHRKPRRLNRIIQAKSLGNFEQRMLAWDWMVQRARTRQMRKLVREYPELKKQNLHYPETREIKFDLQKQLRLFRLRHCFYDVTIKGGWINMDKYQNAGLFGSGESSDDEPIKETKFKWKDDTNNLRKTRRGNRSNEYDTAFKDVKNIRRQSETAEQYEADPTDAEELDIENEIQTNTTKARGTLDSQLSANDDSLSNQKRDTMNSQRSEQSEGGGVHNDDVTLQRDSSDHEREARKTMNEREDGHGQ